MNQDQQYIAERVTKADGCWLWNNSKKDGYGFVPQRTRVARRYRKYYAHQISYIAHKGLIPDGMVVRHKCRNRHCCNPDHLELGTVADNNQDKIRDGVNAKGETHGKHMLTEQDVRTIRDLYATGEYTQTGLGRMFGVGYTAINYIVTRRTWKHI